MSADLPTCPYCNAQLLAGASGRVICPRCGESVAVAPGASPALLASAATEQPAVPPAEPGNPVRANRIVGGIVLGVMVLMATTGLVYALMTVGVRRAHDRALPPKMRKPFDIFRKKKEVSPSPAEPGEAVAPARLAGLGYLPPGTNVVAAVHVEELLASPTAKELRGQGFKIGKVELKLDAVGQWLGLPAEEIDHVVLGVRMSEEKDIDLTPPVHVVVRTRQAYDPEKLRKALQATGPRQLPAAGGGKRTVYLAKLRNLPLEFLLWLADERTFVLGLFSKMEDVPLSPQEGASPLDSEVRQVLEQRLSAGVSIWLAGHSADWEQTVLPTLLGGWKGLPVLHRSKDVRTFAIALQPDKLVRLIGVFHCTDEASAKRIEQQELAPRRKADPEAFKCSRDGEWLNVQMTVDLGGGIAPQWK
jgi:hypothetical protein